MTDLDAIFDTPTNIGTQSANLPRRPGIWRVLSMAAVLGALIVSLLSVLQARTASDVQPRDREQVSLQSVAVSVTDLPVPDGAEITVLGLADAESRRAISAATSIDVPRDSAALIAMTDPDGSIIGLAISAPQADRAVDLSIESTGQALIYLSPGILRNSPANTLANVAVIQADPAFQNVLAAIAANPNISDSNPALEQAHAAIADRTPVQPQQPDQGCDSVFAANAYPASGACIQPKTDGIVVTNEQDRWALIYDNAPDFASVCAAVSPTGFPGSELLIPRELCTGEAQLVAPGPVVDQGPDQSMIDTRIATATAVTALYEYAGPFADIAGASPGFSASVIQHIQDNPQQIVDSISQLLETDDDFADAMDVPGTASTAAERHLASITAASVFIEASDTADLIPQRIAGESGHRALLDFFTRSGELMSAPRTDWRWEAGGFGMIDFRDDS